MKDSSPPVSIRIPKDLLTYVQRVAKDHDLTAAQQIRKVLRDWRDKGETK
jgi:hypothetical protein